MAAIVHRPIIAPRPPLATVGVVVCRGRDVLTVTCRSCGHTGPREDFIGRISEAKRKGRNTGVRGHAGQCKPCRAAEKRAHRRKRPVEALSKRSLTKLGLKQPERVLKAAEAVAVEEARAAWREWIDRRAPDAWIAAYYATSGKPWNNPRLTEAEAYRLRYQTDEVFRLAERVRLRAKKKVRHEPVMTALRAAATGRAPSATLLQRLGYTRDQLKVHIERQFKGRMSWQAFAEGKIHIDHIRPLVAFDLTDEGQFREAFGLPNLRPLWASENLAKGARVEHLI